MVRSPTFKQVMGVTAFILGVGSGADTLVVNHPSPAWWGLFGGGILCGLAYAVAWAIDLASGRPAVAKAAGPSGEPTIAATLVNPRYDDDLRKLDGWIPLPEVVGPETVVIVVGGNLKCELLDRPTAALLRDQIDARAKGHPRQRAVVVSYDFWRTREATDPILRNPVISLGASPKANPLTGDIVKAWKAVGNEPWREDAGQAAMQRRSAEFSPRVAVWGEKAADTRRAVDSWVRQPRGLTEFLRDHAKWG